MSLFTDVAVDDRTRAFIDFLWDCNVLSFGDFTAKSGRRTPYFVNAGRISRGSQLRRLGEFYADAIVDTFGNDVDVVFGPAYKGIPLAVTTGIALTAHHNLDVGVCFDRKEAKDHGEGGSIIGTPLADGHRVVIVEDVTTAGTSIRATVPVLRSIADVEIVGLVVGVDRREHASVSHLSALEELARDFGFTTASLASIEQVVSHLGSTRITEEDRARIVDYLATYGVRPTPTPH